MWFFILLILTEVLTFIVLKEYFYNTSRIKFFFSLVINFILSLWLWFLLIKVTLYRGNYDNPANIADHMDLTGLLCAVVFPRIILISLHFSGKLLRLRKGGHARWLTRSGIILSLVILSIVAWATFYTRYNVKTENVVIRIKGLHPGLDGLKIAQISDLHLSSFYRHNDFLQEIVDTMNSYKPDIIINTGDFISYGWREFDRCDTILSKERSRYGNYAVLGNHDMGTYFPVATDSDRLNIINKMDELISASGYRVLNDENTIVDINGSKLELIGVRTAGKHSHIIYSDPLNIMEKGDSVDFKILLCHDPNQWIKDVVRRTDIDLTFAGHTHGMQMGILTKTFRWSPAKYLYPRWNGLYFEGVQYLYVNRGLGVLAIPFRIWMPPEITLLTIKAA
jgi:predicted MPP superfamily phosphohydrolase